MLICISRCIDEQHVLVGIEPSAILTFRDEYPELVKSGFARMSQEIGIKLLYN